MSTHNRPSLQDHFRAFERGESPFDAFMLRYNAVHRGAEQDVFPHLPASRRPAVLAYTATRWGHLCDPAKMPTGEAPPPVRDCYRFALSHSAVDMVLCGPKNRDQMQEALRALDGGPLAPDERARLERVGDHIYGRYRPQFAEQGDRAAS
jgi:aryl-alcohol dehydrogenase-like predicted oxidoreductase